MRMSIPQNNGPINRTADVRVSRFHTLQRTGYVPIAVHPVQASGAELRTLAGGAPAKVQKSSGSAGAVSFKPDYLRSKTQSAFEPAAAAKIRPFGPAASFLGLSRDSIRP